MASHALASAVRSHHSRLTAPSTKSRVRPPVQLPAVTSLSAPPLPCFDALSFRFSIHYQSVRPKLSSSHPEAAARFATSLLHLGQKSFSAAPRTLVTTSPQHFNHALLHLFSTRCLVRQPPPSRPPGPPTRFPFASASSPTPTRATSPLFVCSRRHSGGLDAGESQRAPRRFVCRAEIRLGSGLI